MEHLKKLLHPLIFTLLGCIAGLFYYNYAPCPTGTCPITSSAMSTMAYTGLIGLLVSRVLREIKKSP